MKKRGFSQIDWVISLGIFLLYIAWFFIFIRPLAVQGGMPELVDDVREKLQEEAYWSVFRYPVMVDSEYSLTYAPVIINVDFENHSNLFMVNRSFFLHNNKLFFLGNLTSFDKSIFELINSGETYEEYSQVTDLAVGSSSATTEGFAVNLENNLIEDVDFGGIKIFDYSLYSGNSKVEPSTTNFSNEHIAGVYPISEQNLNISTIIFAYNSGIYMLFQGDSSVSQTFELDNYESYYFSSEFDGDVHYPGNCYEDESQMIQFYANSSVLLIWLDKEANISFCSHNTLITLNIDFETAGGVMQKIIFYEGSHTNFPRYTEPYSVALGLPEETTAFSMTELQRLNVTGYSRLKSRWMLGDFRVVIFNATNEEQVVSFGGNAYDKATVYAQKTRDFILDKYGSLTDIIVNVQSWT